MGRLITLTPLKLAAIIAVVGMFLGYSIAIVNWWLIATLFILILVLVHFSSPKFWVTLPRKDYEEPVD